MLKWHLIVLLIASFFAAKASSILVPMDGGQKNHLKAYGLTYWALKNGLDTDWLLNYRSGSFLLKYSQAAENECKHGAC